MHTIGRSRRASAPEGEDVLGRRGRIEATTLDCGDEASGVTPGDDQPVLGSRERIASAEARTLHNLLAEDVDEHLHPAALARRGRQSCPSLTPRLVEQAALLEICSDIVA